MYKVITLFSSAPRLRHRMPHKISRVMRMSLPMCQIQSQLGIARSQIAQPD